MPKKKDLIEKLWRPPCPKNFTVRELDLYRYQIDKTKKFIELIGEKED